MAQENVEKYKIVVNLKEYTVSIDPEVNDMIRHDILSELGIAIPSREALVKSMTTLIRFTCIVTSDYTFMSCQIREVLASFGVSVPTTDRLANLMTYFGDRCFPSFNAA